jgi:hypothetical protein
MSHSYGKQFEIKPLLKICVSDGAIVLTATFKILPDILSRPAALPLDKPFKSF